MNKTIKRFLKAIFPFSYYRFSVFSIEKKFKKSIQNKENAIVKRYEDKFGEILDLKNPKTFYEKINYLKLYFDKDVKYLVDKLLVKEYLRTNYPYIVFAKTLLVFNSYNDFKKSVLTKKIPDPCVIKLNHTSGDIFIYKNGKWIDKYGYRINKRCVLACIKYRLNLNFYHAQFEKVYDGITPKVFAEEYLESLSSNGGLDEYKFFCNYGIPRMINVVYGRQKKEDVKEAFLDCKLKPFPINQGQTLLKQEEIYKPNCFKEMFNFASLISKEFPILRVDLFANNNSFIFCEITFYDLAGNGFFYPKEYNKIIGNLFELKEQTNED